MYSNKQQEHLSKIIFSNIEGYNQAEVIRQFFLVSFFNFILALVKGEIYQSSWCKKGLLSISQNLERKYSRMDNMFFPENGKILDIENMGFSKNDGLLDSMSDEANYCNLALSFFFLKSKESEQIKNATSLFLVNNSNFIKDNFTLQKSEKYIKQILEEQINILTDLIKVFDEENDKQKIEKFNVFINNLCRKVGITK